MSSLLLIYFYGVLTVVTCIKKLVIHGSDERIIEEERKSEVSVVGRSLHVVPLKCM